MAYQLQASGQTTQKDRSISKSMIRMLLILVFSPFLFEPPP